MTPEDWKKAGEYVEYCAKRMSAGKPDSEPTLRGLPEDFWKQSIEMQRGWLWKHSIALQEANDLLGRVITKLRNEAVERVQPSKECNCHPLPLTKCGSTRQPTCDRCGGTIKWMTPREREDVTNPVCDPAWVERVQPDAEIAKVIAKAQETVRPIVDKERQCEDVGDVMGFRMKGMGPKETFDWLLERHRKLLEIESRERVQPEPSICRDCAGGVHLLCRSDAKRDCGCPTCRGFSKSRDEKALWCKDDYHNSVQPEPARVELPKVHNGMQPLMEKLKKILGEPAPSTSVEPQVEPHKCTQWCTPDDCPKQARYRADSVSHPPLEQFAAPSGESLEEEAREFRKRWSHKPTPIAPDATGLWYSEECVDQMLIDWAAFVRERSKR